MPVDPLKEHRCKRAVINAPISEDVIDGGEDGCHNSLVNVSAEAQHNGESLIANVKLLD
jgi:hypothetical protein